MSTTRFAAALALITLVPIACVEGFDAEEVDEPGRALACSTMSALVYHVVNPTTQASLYTVTAAEAANAAKLYGFTENRGTPFKAATAAASDLSPVYRMYDPVTNDFLWTIDEAERTSARTTYGYVDQGVNFYASKAANACLTPVYRVVHPSLEKHRMTISTAERDALVANGWRDEGVRFHVASSTAAPPDTDTKFTLVVIPDTQREVRSVDPRFDNRMKWLVDNRSALDIRFVTHTGDVVDWDTSDHIQYKRASTGFTLLDNAQMPYAVALGNHDTAAVCVGGSACPGNTNLNLRDTRTFNQFFPISRFKNLRGVYEPGKVDNAFHTFRAGGVDWVVINLEMWPRTAVINWAKSVLQQLPRHNAIFITHSHLTSGSTIVGTNGGYGDTSPQYVYDNLYTQFANVKFVFSGHTGTTGYLKGTGVKGNTFYQFLNCYHDETSNPTRLMEIDTAARTVATRVYSPYTGTEKNDGSKMTLTGVDFVR